MHQKFAKINYVHVDRGYRAWSAERDRQDAVPNAGGMKPGHYGHGRDNTGMGGRDGYMGGAPPRPQWDNRGGYRGGFTPNMG